MLQIPFHFHTASQQKNQNDSYGTDNAHLTFSGVDYIILKHTFIINLC